MCPTHELNAFLQSLGLSTPTTSASLLLESALYVNYELCALTAMVNTTMRKTDGVPDPLSNFPSSDHHEIYGHLQTDGSSPRAKFGARGLIGADVVNYA